MHIEQPHDLSLSRWERILKCEDDGRLWKAIDWKGRFNPENPDAASQTSESHLEKLRNPADEGILTDLSNLHTTIPVLDQTIEVKEVIEKQIKPNKSCGPDGITPGAFKLLPGQWIAFLCLLFNNIFVAGYPLIWTSAKLRMLFKKRNQHYECSGKNMIMCPTTD